MLQESELIQRIQNKFDLSLQQGLFGAFGDDGFVLNGHGLQSQLVLSTDSFVEGTHFTKEMGFESAGYKGLVSALSDIYAMGVRPSFFSLNLILPQAFKAQNLDVFLEGLHKASLEHGVQLLGGDICKGGQFAAAFQVGGYTSLGLTLSNRGANKGDVILCSHYLGEALLGFKQWKTGLKHTPFVKAFLHPKVRREVGPWLAKREGVSTLRDVSDGLYKELTGLSEANGLSVSLEDLPCSVAFKKAASALGLSFEKLILEGGEEYALLWTLAPDQLEGFMKSYHIKFKKPPFVLGRLQNAKGGKPSVFYENQDLIDSTKPFEHFSS